MLRLSIISPWHSHNEGTNLFGLIKTMYRQAKVQNTLKQQCDNQEFVNQICHPREAVELIHYLYENAYYRKDNLAHWLIACIVLMRAMTDDTFPESIRIKARYHLEERINAMPNDFRIRHCVIVGELENAVSQHLTMSTE
ncbi:TPA: hypothetical protein J6M81_001814 [Escherichia coli]|nr:hypothetical protein [Escherichia coli]